MTGIPIIVLAAGSSSRLGRSKQLLEYEGEPMLKRVVSECLKITNKVVVVLGANYDAHAALLKGIPVTVVRHDDWSKGMGSSIKAGFRVVDDGTNQGVLIVAVDQPFVTSSHLKNLIDGATAGKIMVASSYADTLGIPAYFDQRAFTYLRNLDDEHGAGSVLRNNADLTASVSFASAAIDIDTEDDVRRFLSPG